MIWLIVLSIFINPYTAYKINEYFDRKQRERFAIYEKWLFDSLYSINHKVLLPEEHDKPSLDRKAEVYSPEKDPMFEFTGKKDDWFGE